MIPFRYERPADAPAAVALLHENPGAKLLAGGTNLVDHLKLGIATPNSSWTFRVFHSIPSSRPTTADSGSGPTCATAIWPPTTLSANGIRRCRAHLSPARHHSCAIWPRRAETCSNARAASTSRTCRRRATSGSPARVFGGRRIHPASRHSGRLGRLRRDPPVGHGGGARNARRPVLALGPDGQRRIPVTDFHRLPDATPTSTPCWNPTR